MIISICLVNVYCFLYTECFDIVVSSFLLFVMIWIVNFHFFILSGYWLKWYSNINCESLFWFSFCHSWVTVVFSFLCFLGYNGIFLGVLIKIVLLLEMVLVHIIHDSFCIWKVLIVWPWIDWSSCFVGVDYIKSWIPLI